MRSQIENDDARIPTAWESVACVSFFFMVEYLTSMTPSDDLIISQLKNSLISLPGQKERVDE